MWRPSNIDRPTGVFIGLLVLSLALVTMDLRASGSGLGSTMRDGAQSVFTPLEHVVASATRPVADFFESLSDLFSLSSDNQRPPHQRGAPGGAAGVREAARSEVGFSLRTTADPVAGLTRIDYVKVLVFTRDEATIGGL